MVRTGWIIIAASSLLAAGAAADRRSPQVVVRTDDAERFFRVFDAASGAPTAAVIQRDYLDAGSDGVRQFVPHRIISAEALASEIARNRAVYLDARRCLAALPTVKTRLRTVFTRLAALDPEATFPPVTILVGRNNSGGTTGKSGVLIGMEVVCRSNWLQPDLADRFTHLIAHEYGHVEEAPALDEDPRPTVLKQSLVEGVAELVAEMTSGEVGNAHLRRWTAGRERVIDQAFVEQANTTDLSPWLYNGAGTPQRPGDLGYWIGYRIARAYYDRSSNKQAAIRTLLRLDDPQAVLAASGWSPGATIGQAMPWRRASR